MFSPITQKIYYGCLVIAVAVLPFCFHSAQAAPSFSCDKANAIEKVICSDPGLSEKDQRLASFYSTAYDHAIGKDATSIITTQRKWIMARNKACGTAPSVDCIDRYYNDRLFKLAVNNVFNAHDEALAEIARQYPKLKNVYQAIYDFVTIEDEQKRTSSVAQDIGDTYAQVGNRIQENMTSADIVASSADNIGMFLWSVSTSHYGEQDSPFIVPCEAFIKQPETIVWMEPRAANPIDSQSPVSTCDDVMPVLTHVVELLAKANVKVEIDKDAGRFTIRAQGNADYTALLTHSLDTLHRGDKYDYTTSKQVAPFQQLYAAEFDAAAAELSDYYQRFFHVPAETAMTQARSELAITLSDYLDE